MKVLLFLLFFLPLIISAQDTIYSIAFGSCGHQDKPLLIFNNVVEHHPDLFVFLGDNIYGDTESMFKLKRKYRKLGRKKTYKNLKKTTPIIATWDDHDYGEDDQGKYYPKKEQSKQVFMKFFNEPKNSARRTHEGIYNSYYFDTHGKKIQIILLDLRTFRSDLIHNDKLFVLDSLHYYPIDYLQNFSPDSTIMGSAQWTWLESELRKPADVRIIGSSTQFATEYNGYETWSNFPMEQQKMLDLIKTTGANGVVFISGDVHYSELSKIENPGAYPIYDLTASGLTEEWKFATPNKFRVGGPVMENHFGMINVLWKQDELSLSLEIWDKFNVKRIEQIVPLSELKGQN